MVSRSGMEEYQTDYRPANGQEQTIMGATDLNTI
jgi:hypothetical protein